MTPSVTSYLAHALARTTQSTYRSGWSSYTRFCALHSIPRLPLTEATLLPFFAHLADRHLLHSTLRVYLSALTYYSRIAGYPFNIRHMPRLHYLLMGVRRSQGGAFSVPRRTPLFPQHLVSLRTFLLAHYPPVDARMLWAAFTSAFFGLLRASEYTCPTDSTIVPSTLLLTHFKCAPDFSSASLRLPISKADQFGRGVLVDLFPLPSPLCPLSAILHYLAVRRPLGSPLFLFADGTFLTRAHVVDILRSVFPAHPTLNTHSFRIGGASALAAAGVPDYVIRVMGRWSSDAYLRYVHIPTSSLRAFHHSMLGGFPA